MAAAWYVAWYEPLAFAASCAALVWFWFVHVEATFDHSVFALETNTNKYVLFIGSFTYVMLVYALDMFIADTWAAHDCGDAGVVPATGLK